MWRKGNPLTLLVMGGPPSEHVRLASGWCGGWPGFGDNSRVLKWICQRIEGQVKANVTPIGNLPLERDIDLSNNEGKFKVVIHRENNCRLHTPEAA